MEDSIKKDLFKLYQDKNLLEILKDRGLSNLGDNFTNFIYSLAKSKVLNQATGWKVSGKTLATALKESGLREFCPSRASTHDLADFAESIIVYLWFTNNYTIDQMVSILAEEMNDGIFKDLKKEERTAIKAFTILFIEFKNALKKINLI